MKLTKEDLFKIEKTLQKAAKSSGDIINNFKSKSFKVMSKISGNSLASQIVTEVDFLSQENILQIINPVIEKYSLGLLTEEEDDDKSRLIKDYFICIDPLDGTKSFVESDYGYSVSVSLINKLGEPIIGVVYNPVSKNLYSAVKSFGLFKNNTMWIPSKTMTKGLLNIIIDPSNNIDLSEITNINLYNCGGAVVNAIEILEGRADAYFKPPKNENGGGSIWDFSSTFLMFYESGFIATDFFGKKIKFNNPKTTFMNKNGIFFAKNSNILRILSLKLLK